jgi:hypothetical protein
MRLAVLLGLASVLLPAAPAVAATQPPVTGSCERAKALYEAHYYAQAESEYKALLGVASCATPSLAMQAQVKAEKLAKQAQVKAEKVATSGPHLEEQLGEALRLQAAGFESEARKLVKEVVEKASTPIPSQLRAPDQQLGWWREALGTGGPPARTALEILIVVGGTVLVLLLLVTGLNALRLRFVRSARLEGFSGSQETNLAPVLSAALGAMLARMSDESPGRSLSWQSGTEPKFEFPASITEAVPQAGLLAGLVQMIDKLLYRRLFIVSGTVHPPHEHRGAGITLVVTNRNGRDSEQVTVWESDFLLKEAGAKAKEPVRYERLILPVAVWLGYCRILGFKQGPYPPLGARDWRSYALFALGELVPDPTKQRRLYELALDRDSGNIGARLNLAALLLQRPSGQVPPGNEDAEISSGTSEGWQERLHEAAAHLEVVAESNAAAGQPIWYRSRYMDAICCLYLGHAPDATKALSELRLKMKANAKVPRLRGLIEALGPPTDILERSIALIRTPPSSDDIELSPGWLSEDGEYNFACLQARRAGILTGTARDEATVEAVRALRRAIARDEKVAAEARVDPAFDAIRDHKAFKSLVAAAHVVPEVVEPVRYAITLDAGPHLLRLARRS